MNAGETILRELGQEGKRHQATLLGNKRWVLAQLKDHPGEEACTRDLTALLEEIIDFVYNFLNIGRQRVPLLFVHYNHC